MIHSEIKKVVYFRFIHEFFHLHSCSETISREVNSEQSTEPLVPDYSETKILVI